MLGVRRRARVASGLAGLIGLAARPVVAAPEQAEPIALEWDAPAGCPSHSRVLEEMQARWHADPGFDRDIRIQARVRVDVSEAGLVAQLHVTAPSGSAERTLKAERCETIVEASALIVAMTAGAMLEPLPASEDLAPTPPEPAETTAPADPATSDRPPDPPRVEPPQSPPEPGPPPAEDPPRRSLGGQVRASGGIGLGGINTVAGSVGGGAGLTVGRWQLDAVGRFWFAQRLPITGREEFGADVRLWTIGPRGGPVLRWRRFEFPLQLGLDAGLAHARGYGVTTPRTSARPWVSAGLFPAALWRATPHVGLGIGAELSAVLLRPRFTIADAGPLPSTRGAHGGLTARIQIRFP